MGKNLVRNQGMGLCRHEIDIISREDKPQLHYELHEHSIHGDFWMNERKML